MTIPSGRCEQNRAGQSDVVLALFRVNDGLAKPLLVIEEFALELGKLFVGIIAYAQKDLLELLQVLHRGSHRASASGRARPETKSEGNHSEYNTNRCVTRVELRAVKVRRRV